MTTVETPPSDLLTLAERTAQVDRLAAEVEDLPHQGFALLAVGGYGRRHLFPYSDIDLLLLFESERLMTASKPAIAAYLQRLWDAGLRVSQSVRTPAECLQVHPDNIELNVSLLDQRYLAGDRALYAELARRLPHFLQASREPLARNLTQLARQRHARYADTFYHLEPNVKEGPGGLRDYQLLRWLDQLRDSGGSEPPAELREAFASLAHIRCFLHQQAGRDRNVLTFDAQDALAEHEHAGDSAAWMRGYYRHARAVFRAAARAMENSEAHASALFAQFRDRRSRLSNADFSVLRGQAHFRLRREPLRRPEMRLPAQHAEIGIAEPRAPVAELREQGARVRFGILHRSRRGAKHGTRVPVVAAHPRGGVARVLVLGQRILRVEREHVLVAARLLVEEAADVRQRGERLAQLGRGLARPAVPQLVEPAQELIIAQPARPFLDVRLQMVEGVRVARVALPRQLRQVAGQRLAARLQEVRQPARELRV